MKFKILFLLFILQCWTEPGCHARNLSPKTEDLPVTTGDPTNTIEAARSQTYRKLASDRTGLEVISAGEPIPRSLEHTSVEPVPASSDSGSQVTSAEKPVEARNDDNIPERATATALNENFPAELSSNGRSTDGNTQSGETSSSPNGQDHAPANMIDIAEKFHGQDVRLVGTLNQNTSGNTSIAKSKDVRPVERRTNESLASAASGGGGGEGSEEGDGQGGERREGRTPEAGEITGLIFSHVVGAIEDTLRAYIDILPLISGCVGGVVGCHVCVAMVQVEVGPKMIINKCLEKCTPGLFGACVGLVGTSLNIVLTFLLSNLSDDG